MFVIYGISDCPYCLKARALLMDRDKEFTYMDLDFSPLYRGEIKEKVKMKTLPIIVYYKTSLGENPVLIGGFEDLQKSLLYTPLEGQGTNMEAF